MNDFATARKNMVDTQVSPADVTDRRLLQAMRDLPREHFAPASLRDTAYMDGDLVVQPKSGGTPGRYLLAPMVFGKMVQLADIQSGDLLLDLGCATGYSSAILARLADSVVALEEDSSLAEQAEQTLNDLQVDNAAVVNGPLNEGFAGEGPYDVIFVNGSVPEVPRDILGQLKPGGRLVCVLAEDKVGQVVIFLNVNGEYTERSVFSASAMPLPGFQKTSAFVF